MKSCFLRQDQSWASLLSVEMTFRASSQQNTLLYGSHKQGIRYVAKTVLCCSLKHWWIQEHWTPIWRSTDGFFCFFRTHSYPSEAHTVWQQWVYTLDLCSLENTDPIVSASSCWAQGQSRRFHFSCSWASLSLFHSRVPKPQTPLLLPLQTPFTQSTRFCPPPPWRDTSVLRLV